MSNIRIIEDYRNANTTFQTLSANNKRLKNGDGGGIYNDMETRVKRLEDQFDKMNDLLIRIDERTKTLATKEDVATVKTELKAKIGWPALATAAAIIIAALSAVIALL